MLEVLELIEGMVIGVFMGSEDQASLVIFSGNLRKTVGPARSLAALDQRSICTEVALLAEGGDPPRPLMVGRIVGPGHRDVDPQVIFNRERGMTGNYMLNRRLR